MSLKRLVGFALVVIFAAALYFPAYPIAGFGAHYGYDMSLTMEDVTKEQASLDQLKLDTSFFGGATPASFTKAYLSGKDLPVYIQRLDWERHPFNLGGKFYIDIIPFIDAIEVSANYGMWQYQGNIIYPTKIDFKTNPPTNTQDINQLADISYDTTMITLKDLGINNPFLKKTPYAKLNFDFTARKYLLQVPPLVKFFKIYGGAGMTLNFATPLLSASFIQKAIGTSLASATDVSTLGTDLFDPSNPAMKKLGQEFMKQLFTPHMGGHLDLGAMIKFPIMPVGLYIDGKFMFPFGKMDDGADLKASGLLINSGILFGL